MKQLLYVSKYLLKVRGNNVIKVLSITLGFAVGVILLSQVAFETSYDKFYPDKERMYQIWCTYHVQEESSDDSGIYYPMTHAVRDEIPGILSATMWAYGDNAFNYKDQFYPLELYYADSLFFDFFSVEMLQGDLHKGFEKEDHIFISASAAQRIFKDQDPMGQILFQERTKPYTVVGVFKDFPKNSSLAFDAVMPVTNALNAGYYNSWDGGARWSGYVKLADGVDPDSIAAKIPDLVTQHAGEPDPEMTYLLVPITELHKPDLFIYSMLAFIIMAVAAMNYILTTVSSLSTRARTMAMHKCNGSTNKGIFNMMIIETTLLILCSLGLTVCLLLGFQQQIGQIISTPFSALFAPGNLAKVLLVIIPLFLVAGVIPATIFASIPVALAFRHYTLNKRLWKQCLLFIQFLGATILVTLLAIVSWQYNQMLTKDIGYKYDNRIFAYLSTITAERQAMLKEELKRMPEIQQFSMAQDLPATGMSGEFILHPGSKESMFHTSWTRVDPEFFQTLGIPLKEGVSFTEQSTYNQVVVNEEFVRQMNCTGSPLGQTFFATGHYSDGPNTIIGVMQDFYTSSLRAPIHPLMISYADLSGCVVMHLHTMNPETIATINEKLSKLFPDANIAVYVYKNIIEQQYTPEMLFRHMVLLGVIVTLLILLIGIIGYTNDEIQRRSKEIAIRKVNGASAWQVIWLIMRDIRWAVLGGILIGLTLAFLIGRNYLQQFVVKIPLGVGLLSLCGVFILLLTLVTIVVKTNRIANENPVKSIKKE